MYWDDGNSDWRDGPLDLDVAAAITGTLPVANVEAGFLPLAGGTMTAAFTVDAQGIEFEESDDAVTCASGDYWIRADTSETTLKKCLDGSETDLDTGGAVSEDDIGTTELDDGANSPTSGGYLVVDAVDQAGVDYFTPGEVLSDIGAAPLAGPVFTGSVELPNAAGPTVDGAGEIAIDTDPNGDMEAQLLVYDGDSAEVVPSVLQACVTIESLTDDDDGKPIWANIAYTSATVISATCTCIGVCTTPGIINFQNAQTGSPGNITSDGGNLVCDGTDGSIDIEGLSGGHATFTRGEVLLMSNGQTSTTADDDYVICVSYKVDRQ
jgi:hypothetical protein